VEDVVTIGIEEVVDMVAVDVMIVQEIAIEATTVEMTVGMIIEKWFDEKIQVSTMKVFTIQV